MVAPMDHTPTSTEADIRSLDWRGHIRLRPGTCSEDGSEIQEAHQRLPPRAEIHDFEEISRMRRILSRHLR